MSGSAPSDLHVWNTTVTLLRHEARTLWQNRMACFVLALAVLTSVFLRIDRNRRPELPEEVCYVLYWEEDALIRHLKVEAGRAAEERQLHIEVLPADQFAGNDGVIRYPPGSHSIQLRISPHSPGGLRGREIWYWYSGSDVSAIWPYAEWFQQAAFMHLDPQADWAVRAESLRPELMLLGRQTRLSLDAFRDPRQSSAMLVWVVLFFVACHLPKLSLAESVSGGMILSIVTTPAGWRGVAWTLRIFYGSLAVAMAAVVTAILQPAALLIATFWLTVVCATILYLGVAFVIGAWCRSVASASAGTIAYVFLSGAAFLLLTAVSRHLEIEPRLDAIADVGIMQALKSAGESMEVAQDLRLLTGPLAWAACWHLAGELSFRRLRTR